MRHDPDELETLASIIWVGPLSEDDAAMLHRLMQQVGRQELAARLGALALRVTKGMIDPPSAAVWLDRQRPRHGPEP